MIEYTLLKCIGMRGKRSRLFLCVCLVLVTLFFVFPFVCFSKCICYPTLLCQLFFCHTSNRTNWKWDVASQGANPVFSYQKIKQINTYLYIHIFNTFSMHYFPVKDKATFKSKTKKNFLCWQDLLSEYLINRIKHKINKVSELVWLLGRWRDSKSWNKALDPPSHSLHHTVNHVLKL